MKITKYLITSALSLSLLLPTAATAGTFSDVSQAYWAYPSISKLSSDHIIEGYADGTFRPGASVTRAQAAKILANAIDAKEGDTFSTNFTDLSQEHWAYNEISALTKKGVFANSEKFNPNDQLTRSQMSKIIVEGFNIQMDDNHLTSFKDVQSGYWQPYIITLAELQISHGISPTTFGPNGTVTRAQLSAFIDRALQFDNKRQSGLVTYDENKKKYIDNTKNDSGLETAQLVNGERQNAGLNKLEVDPELSRIAEIKAEDMVKNNYFDHNSPTFGSPFDMAKEFDYSYSSFGENIAYGYTTPESVVKGWMDSPGHKANILHNGYTNIGVGTAKDSQGRIYWVHMFSSK